MKKTIGAAALMLLMIAVSAWNIRHLDALADRLDGEIRRSRACWTAGDAQGAAAALEDALRDWRGEKNYTYIFLRHTEIDDFTNAFYDVFSALDGDGTGVGPAYDRLQADLQDLKTMEHVTVGTVF